MLNDQDLLRLFGNLPGQFLVLRPDAAFTIVCASQAYLRTTHTDASIYGQSLFDVFPDDPRQAEATGAQNVLSSLQRVLATGQPDAMAVQRYDVRLPAAVGGGFEERYWTPINTPVLADDGSVAYIVHQVEEASAKGNRNAIQILESITEGFFTLDRQWRFDYVNREAHHILGRDVGDLSGKVLWQVYPGLEGTEFERHYHRTMFRREKTSFTAHYPLEARWYEVTTFPAAEGMSVYFRDVTEQKRLEAERQELMAASEQQRRIYETALDSTPDFVYVFDLDHRALYANGALLKTWGVDDVSGKRWMDLGYAQWHADLHDSEIDRVIATRAPIRGEIPFTGTNGTRVYDYIFAPVLDASGEVVAVAGTTRDVTDRQAAEQAMRDQAERLAQADLAKDDFLATLSHELRNPLVPLRNGIELLRRYGHADDRATRVCAMMERQITQLARLVDDLLEMSRVSRGTFLLQKERVELAAVVRTAVETSDALIKAGGHTLEVTLPEEPVWVEGDPVRLTQILANLLNNAAKFTDERGRIAVRARQDGQSAVVSVVDNGIGIEPTLLPRLFEMFSRGHRDTARNQAGLGIGLALSRRLAEMHDGRLEVHSAGAGEGSEFTFSLPVAEAPVAVEPAMHEMPERPLAHLRVLVVDDNRDVAESLADMLDMLGADVRVAHDGASGIAAYADWQPPVVLLDIGMPGMNGYEVARAIRGRFPQRTPTLVALTGWGQEEDRRRAREAGFDHHLVKPAAVDALRDVLGALAR